MAQPRCLFVGQAIQLPQSGVRDFSCTAGTKKYAPPPCNVSLSYYAMPFLRR